MARRSTAKSQGASTDLMRQLQALDEQRKSLIDGAKQGAMAAAHSAIAALNSLGFNYRLVEAGRGSARTRAAGSRAVKDAPCPICGFKTNPPHDRRAHRGQQTKKPFTAAELKAKGLEKVE